MSQEPHQASLPIVAKDSSGSVCHSGHVLHCHAGHADLLMCFLSGAPTWSELLPGGRQTSKRSWASSPASSAPAHLRRCAAARLMASRLPACLPFYKQLAMRAGGPARALAPTHAPHTMQYLPEHVVFKEQRFNVLLTAGEFASRDLLEQYWSEQYAQGMVHGTACRWGKQAPSSCLCRPCAGGCPGRFHRRS